jgi:DNA-binding transcriptional LysR family regulator
LALAAGHHQPRAAHRFTLKELAQEQMLVSYWGPGSEAFLERVRNAGEGKAGMWLELSPVELVKGMLLAGNGISLVPEIAVRRELAAGELVKLRLADSGVRLPMWEIALIRHRRRGTVNAAGEALTRTLAAVLPKLAK